MELRNATSQDQTFNVGISLANGAKQYPHAVKYTLTLPSGQVLHLEPVEPGFIAGRVDPLIASLPVGAAFSFEVDLRKYAAPKEKIWKINFPPGSYTLQAQFTGRAVSMAEANLDFKGVALMRYWLAPCPVHPLFLRLRLRRRWYPSADGSWLLLWNWCETHP
ncbi:hypothetical protein [Silvibacterium dinghuense]|uniref:Uncharacterized protein n=1 Tax=Silvibacterium dinghuense TaxID=1560006 RepID=A0A4Q1SHB9_9BACT|nr:hypothetical protein [Silvibacterium dinghuense]RXS96944.1 hypothetical protein ESZ00_03135 [Silvibacterium dinghuense]